MESEVIETETVVAQNEAVDERDEDLIAQRAYEIHMSGEGGTDFDNWLRAERELREERRSQEAD
jgi:hypothetical protein